MPPTKWVWTKKVDDDGHPFWTANGASIWLSGGDVGEYLTDAGTRHATLAGAKRAAREWWEGK